jgi:hypothetical protein
VIDADFDVEYTIDLMPHYRDELERYQMENGIMPEGHLKVQNLYRKMANDIKNIMPQLKICKKYF